MYFTKEHEWVKIVDDTAEIGITDYAQKSLGDVVFIELPEIGTVFNSGEEISDIESVKAASPVYCPVSGTVFEVNNKLSEKPELINSDPYSSWICRLNKISFNLDELLTEEQYENFIKA